MNNLAIILEKLGDDFVWDENSKSFKKKQKKRRDSGKHPTISNKKGKQGDPVPDSDKEFIWNPATSSYQLSSR